MQPEGRREMFQSLIRVRPLRSLSEGSAPISQFGDNVVRETIVEEQCFQSSSSSPVEDIISPMEVIAVALSSSLYRTCGTMRAIEPVIDDAISDLQQFLQEDFDENLSRTQIQTIRDIMQHYLKGIQNISSYHRESHIFISRLGRAIDNCLNSRHVSEAVIRPGTEFIQNSPTVIDMTIFHYLLINGFKGVADTLIAEGQLCLDSSVKAKLWEFDMILNEIRLFNINPLWNWIYEQTDGIDRSHLIFKLHKVTFRRQLLNGGVYAGVSYARENFSQYGDKYPEEIAEIMATMVRDDALVPPTYDITIQDLFFWNEITNMFIKDIARMLNLAPESYLQHVVDIGCKMIPKIIKVNDRLVKTGAAEELFSKDELPIENINEEHSIFVCPVMRQPLIVKCLPMRLLCGHVISKSAVDHLTVNSRIKCPYCPMTHKSSDSILINF